MEWITKWLTGEGGLLKVRAGLALGTTAVTLFMWATEITVSSEQLIILTAIVTHYFSGRAGDKMADIAANTEEKVVNMVELDPPNGA